MAGGCSGCGKVVDYTPPAKAKEYEGPMADLIFVGIGQSLPYRTKDKFRYTVTENKATPIREYHVGELLRTGKFERPKK